MILLELYKACRAKGIPIGGIHDESIMTMQRNQALLPLMVVGNQSATIHHTL